MQVLFFLSSDNKFRSLYTVYNDLSELQGLKLIHSLQARVASKIFLLLAKVKSLVKSVKLFPVFIHVVECKQAARKRTLSFSGTAQYIHSFYGSNLYWRNA